MIMYELRTQIVTADEAFCVWELNRTMQDTISEPRYKILRRVVISTTPNLILNRQIDFVLAAQVAGITFTLAFCGYFKDFIGGIESSKL